MPRVSEDRPPAEPTSPEQIDRYRRILRAAAQHGAAKGLERMQMMDVARDAGVAIATLYRYFPSKTHLFTSVMRDRVEYLSRLQPGPRPGEAAEESIARLLVRVGREMLRAPLLSHAMIQSNNASVAQSPQGGVTQVFTDVMLAAAGMEEPTDHDRRLLRLLEQAWYGILMSALNGHITLEEMDDDTRLICRVLLRERDAVAR